MEGEVRQRDMHPGRPKYVGNLYDLNLSTFEIAKFSFPEGLS